MIKNILICGLGATGCIFANKINKNKDFNFKVLVDRDRLERYIKNPIELNGEILDFEYILPEDKSFKADLIIISTKSDGLATAIDNIENFVTSDTIIMSLLNGITSEKIIAKKYGSDKVLTSYWIGHSAMRNGNKVIHDGVAKIVFGTKDGLTKNVSKVRDLLEKTNIEYEIPDDINYNLWLKFMLNVSTNQPSAVYNATFGDMLNNPKITNLIENLMKEVQQIAKAEGIKNTEKMIDEAKIALNTMIPNGKTSMLQDVLAKRKTEVDIFAGTMIELGKKHNIPVPYNEIMKKEIEKIQDKYNLN